jgi:acyl-CoA thioesterase
MTEFDDDTALERRADGWYGRVTDRWSIREGHANGGYIASFLIRAFTEATTQPDPLTMTTHFLEAPTVGEGVVVRVETLREGRSHTFLSGRLEQDGRTVAAALATFGRRREGGPVVSEPAPDVARPEQLDEPAITRFPGMTFRDRFQQRFLPEHDPSGWPREGPARSGGWQRLVDRDVDDLAVPLFMDAWIPAVFASLGWGVAPTLELTVHWRSRPQPGWHLGMFSTRFVLGGYMEEDGELWGEDGSLVALSRQLARFSPDPALQLR